MKAHFFKDGKRWRFSGYSACGDAWDGAGDRSRLDRPLRPFDAIVDVGRGFHLTWDGELYLYGPGPGKFCVFTPTAVLLSAKLGQFGFKIIAGGKEYANG